MERLSKIVNLLVGLLVIGSAIFSYFSEREYELIIAGKQLSEKKIKLLLYNSGQKEISNVVLELVGCRGRYAYDYLTQKGIPDESFQDSFVLQPLRPSGKYSITLTNVNCDSAINPVDVIKVTHSNGYANVDFGKSIEEIPIPFRKKLRPYLFVGALAMVLIAVALVAYLRLRLPPEVRYPPKDTDDLNHLLATFIRQTQSVESRPVRLYMSNGQIFSGLPVKEKSGKDIILLPRQYKVRVTKEDKFIQKLKDAYQNKKVDRFSKLLESAGDSLEAIDGLKKINNGLEEGFDGSLKPQKFKESKIQRSEVEQRKEELLYFESS